MQVLAGVVMSMLGGAAQGETPPQVGEVFPDLVFPQLEGEGMTSLAEFRGTKVLLIQFASW